MVYFNVIGVSPTTSTLDRRINADVVQTIVGLGRSHLIFKKCSRQTSLLTGLGEIVN